MNCVIILMGVAVLLGAFIEIMESKGCSGDCGCHYDDFDDYDDYDYDE